MCSDDQVTTSCSDVVILSFSFIFFPLFPLLCGQFRTDSLFFTFHLSSLRLAIIISFWSRHSRPSLNLSSQPILTRTCIPDSILSPLSLLLSWSFSVRHPQHRHPPGPPPRPTSIVRRMETHPRNHLPRKRCRLLRRAWHVRLLGTL